MSLAIWLIVGVNVVADADWVVNKFAATAVGAAAKALVSASALLRFLLCLLRLLLLSLRSARKRRRRPPLPPIDTGVVDVADPKMVTTRIATDGRKRGMFVAVSKRIGNTFNEIAFSFRLETPRLDST